MTTERWELPEPLWDQLENQSDPTPQLAEGRMARS
jgi:hypothetical protein